jgi:hypothetical protein
VSKNGKSSKDSSKAVVGHGVNGNLIPGAGAGRQPGAGRPSNEIRRSLREILDKGLPHLEEFVKGGRADAKPADQLRAIEIAGKFGLDVKVDKSLVDELWAAIELHVPEENRPALKREFNLIVGRRLAEAVLT